MANKSSSKSLISKASPHTIKKFELIEEYVKSWAQKLMLNNFCNTLVFIDCMCNSGIYINDETGQQTEGTPVRVAKVLLDVARNYPGKNIEMYLNDIDPLRVEEIKKHLPSDERNFRIITQVGDASEFLHIIGPQLYDTKYLHYFLLYDPYDASIDWEALFPFFRNWGEVLINHMVSDPVRAITQAKRKSTKEKYENTYLADFEKLVPYGSDIFFKENLSTGWDCPRAETMMSFKRANDATYIAQLLGRMIRTPMQMHIEVDDVLNDVHLYLPYFNEDTVKDIVEALQNSEGGEIPADIVGESTAGKKFDTLTVKSGKKGKSTPCPGQLTLDGLLHNPTQSDLNQVANPVSTETSDRPDSTMRVEPAIQNPKQELQKSNQAQPVSDAENQPNSETHIGNVTSFDSPSVTDNVPATMEGHASSASEPPTDLFDREAVMKFINDSGLLSYNVRSLRINNYLKSLYKMAHLLTMSRLRREAIREVQSEIADMIHTYVQDLKAKEKYEDLVLQVKQFKLATQIFDAFGETVDNYSVHDLFTTTDTDIDRQFRIADVKLGNEGIGMFYGNKYMDDADPSGFKVDVILFAADGECMIKLYQYAETRFHRMNDDYRRYFATITSEDELDHIFDTDGFFADSIED